MTASPADRLGSKALVGSKKSRTRVLRTTNYAACGRRRAREQYPWQPLYKLLVMTGQRLSDVSDARWPEFNFDKRVRTLHIIAKRQISFPPWQRVSLMSALPPHADTRRLQVSCLPFPFALRPIAFAPCPTWSTKHPIRP